MLPELRRVLTLVREVAAAKAARLGKSPYKSLLDEYEPGGSTAAIDLCSTTSRSACRG